jgi:hypothetical protein
MFASQNLLPGQRKYLYGLFLLSFISVICGAFMMNGSDDYDMAKREILLRRVGHELLLQSGDSTSRVLPVKRLSDREYLISFENELTFLPDSLVNTTQRLLAKDPIAQDYVVNVLNCGNSSVAYGYAISKNKKDDIVACKGRQQPVGCYMINVKFKPAGIVTTKNGFLLGSLPFFAFVGFIFLRSVKPKKAAALDQNTDMLSLGPVLFDAKNRKLIVDGKAIEMTETETRLLSIFASSPNQTIERSRLQKEIWEDEGVIVGRSLDMFISKLRRKLDFDPNINIVVIRGKGYRLEISA